MIISLPWMDRRLSPNARVHWRIEAKVKATAKDAAFYMTKYSWGGTTLPDGPIPMTVTFTPPDRLKRDDDNVIAAFKSARDGIALALKVDDSRFKPTYIVAAAEFPGRVEVAFL